MQIIETLSVLDIEMHALTQAGLDDLIRVGGENLAYAVIKIRAGQATIVPGFDGQHGTVRPIL